MNGSNSIIKKVYLRLKNVLSSLLNKTCELCLEDNFDEGFLCADCENSLPQSQSRCQMCAIPLLSPGYCGQCLAHKPAFDLSHCNFNYGAPIDSWLHQLKDQRKTQWAQKLAQLMLLNPPPFLTEVDVFTFVPSTRWSLIKRGFNPGELITRELGRKLNKPVIAKLAKRSHGSEQKNLNRQQRINNVHKHFHSAGKQLNHQHIMLIDDVMTTGSTAHTMATILKVSGASKVSVWCFARTPKH